MRIVVNYRKEGSGIFAETLETAAKQYLQETPDAKYEATLGEVDHALDQLMEYGGKREMAKAVVRPLTNKLRPRELYWLVSPYFFAVAHVKEGEENCEIGLPLSSEPNWSLTAGAHNFEICSHWDEREDNFERLPREG